MSVVLRTEMVLNSSGYKWCVTKISESVTQRLKNGNKHRVGQPFRLACVLGRHTRNRALSHNLREY